MEEITEWEDVPLDSTESSEDDNKRLINTHKKQPVKKPPLGKEKPPTPVSRPISSPSVTPKAERQPSPQLIIDFFTAIHNQELGKVKQIIAAAKRDQIDITQQRAPREFNSTSDSEAPIYPFDAGGTALHWAARHSDSSLLKYLLDNANIDVNEYDQHEPGQRTAMHYAALAGQAENVRLLYLKQGGLNSPERYIDPETKKPFEHKYPVRPVHLAAQSGNPKTIDYFIKYQAELDENAVMMDLYNNDTKDMSTFAISPLMIAFLGGHYECVNLLLRHKVDTKQMASKMSDLIESRLPDLRNTLPKTLKSDEKIQAFFATMWKYYSLESDAKAVLANTRVYGTLLKFMDCLDDFSRLDNIEEICATVLKIKAAFENIHPEPPLANGAATLLVSLQQQLECETSDLKNLESFSTLAQVLKQMIQHWNSLADTESTSAKYISTLNHIRAQDKETLDDPRVKQFLSTLENQIQHNNNVATCLDSHRAFAAFVQAWNAVKQPKTTQLFDNLMRSKRLQACSRFLNESLAYFKSDKTREMLISVAIAFVGLAAGALMGASIAVVAHQYATAGALSAPSTLIETGKMLTDFWPLIAGAIGAAVSTTAAILLTRYVFFAPQKAIRQAQSVFLNNAHTEPTTLITYSG